MGETNTYFGQKNFSYGPSNVYWDTATGGENLALGKTDQITHNHALTKIDLKSSQDGDRPADKAISSQIPAVSMGLAQATAERLAAVMQGFEVEKNSAGEIIRIVGEDLVGQRDSDIRKQLTMKRIIDGVETTNPLFIIDYFLAAPSTEEGEWVYDATTQQYVNVQFVAYKSANLSLAGRFLYWASREVIA